MTACVLIFSSKTKKHKATESTIISETQIEVVMALLLTQHQDLPNSFYLVSIIQNQQNYSLNICMTFKHLSHILSWHKDLSLDHIHKLIQCHYYIFCILDIALLTQQIHYNLSFPDPHHLQLFLYQYNHLFINSNVM